MTNKLISAIGIIGGAVAAAFGGCEYSDAAEPPVRCGESHLSGLTEPPVFVT